MVLPQCQWWKTSFFFLRRAFVVVGPRRRGSIVGRPDYGGGRDSGAASDNLWTRRVPEKHTDKTILSGKSSDGGPSNHGACKIYFNLLAFHYQLAETSNMIRSYTHVHITFPSNGGVKDRRGERALVKA